MYIYILYIFIFLTIILYIYFLYFQLYIFNNLKYQFGNIRGTEFFLFLVPNASLLNDNLRKNDK